MLSSVLPPIANTPVGQHPYLIRLIKGIFNSRPPQVKLLPEWDLEVVLNMLQKSPFEPLKVANLKLTTFKAVFLTAICSFRRCSDLQSLRLGEGSVSVKSRGITFIRHGLAKQDRQSHFGATIFIPCYSVNKLIDPKRALYFYLKKTEKFRKNAEGQDETKLFLSLCEPHKPVSCQTISKWIVNTIKMAYADKTLRVKGHSTRSVGPSFALFNGASLKAVLEAADWSSESCFVKHYLKDTYANVLN